MAAAGNKKELSYGATYKAYTESGAGHFKTGFNGVLDALRELLDNAVQYLFRRGLLLHLHGRYALKGNTELGEHPEIQLVISLKGRPEEHTVAVGDNGRGMDEELLHEFLKYFNTHEHRGIEAETEFQTTHKDNDIGMYGIGAKEAVFYLGDGVEVMTKHRNEDKELSLSMSKRRYEKRSADGVPQELVLKDDMDMRPWAYGEPPAPPSDGIADIRKCKPVAELLGRYACDRHYNIMVVPRFEHSSCLNEQQDVDRLAQALANTYAMQMFPERYDELFAHTMSKAQSQSHTATKGCKIDLIFESDTHSASISLHDLVEKGHCYVGKFLNQSILRPEYVKCFEGTYNRREGQGSVQPIVIRGVLTYFPFESDMETKPVWEDEGSKTNHDTSKTNPILVFWKNRLVPYDLLKDLCFLQPKTHSNAVQEFRHRCCGILFFPREMRMSRNKMNLQHDKQSLYDALLPWSDETTASSGNCVWKRELTGSTQHSALNWLKKMHSFDKEIQFNGPVAISAETQNSRDESEEQRVTKWVFACCEASQRDKLGQSPTFTGFGAAKFSSEAKLVVKVGDKVKVKSSQIQYGVVQEIVAQGRQSDGYRGQGWFLLKRYPEEIYRDEFRGYPMSRLTQKGSGNGKVDDDEWDGEMRKQSAHLPTHLELFHWAPPSKKTGKEDFSKPGRKYSAQTSPSKLHIGNHEEFRRKLDFTVQIFGAAKKTPPMSSVKDTKLKVICRVAADPTDETTEQGAVSLENAYPKDYICDAPFKNSNHQYFFGSSKNSYAHRASAFIKDWTTAGMYSVTFLVTDSSRQNPKVYQVNAPTLKFKVCSGAAHDMVEVTNWAAEKQLRLGKQISDKMTFELRDVYGNNVEVPSALPEIRFDVQPEPPYKDKKSKEKDTLTQKKDSNEKMFAMSCVPERHRTDAYLLVLRNIVLDSTGKYHPDNDGYEEKEAQKILGLPRPTKRGEKQVWRRASFAVSLRFGNLWIESKGFKVAMLPGIPSDIKPVVGKYEEDKGRCIMRAQNGDKLPQFAVQLIDHVGINTYPLERANHICKLVAEQDVFAEDADVEATFTAQGKAEFKRVVTHVTDQTLFNKRIDLRLECDGIAFSSHKGLMDAKLSMKVAPSNRPSRIEVWRTADERAIGENYLEEVGIEFEDLTLMLFDESGKELQLPPGTLISASWYTNKKKPCTTPNLPTLKLPSEPGSYPYEVRIKLPQRGKTQRHSIDEYSFEVTVVPGCALQWKMQLEETEVRCGVEQDLHRALKVYAADQYGNRAREEESDDPPIEPILNVKGATLTARCPKSKQTKETTLRTVNSRRLSAGMEGYKLVQEYRIGQKARLDGRACKCDLTVLDGDGRLRPCDGKVDLVPGEPYRITLESNVIGDAENADEQVEDTRYVAHIPAKHKLEDLQAKLVDTGGNVVQGVQAPLTLRATGDSDVAMSKTAVKTRAKQGIARFPPITLSAGKSARSYTLQVDCRPAALELLSAQLVCNVVLSNAVIDMEHELSVRVAICGKPLDVGLKLDLLTEDGNSFVPTAGSFDCTIKRKNENKARPSQQHKTATPVFDPFDGGASIKDGVWVLDDVGGDPRPFVPEQAGVYQITCVYRESRAGMQADTPLKALKVDVPIQPAAAIRLVCSKTGTVNANNGRAVNGRKLLKFKITCEDKYGNAGLFPEGCILRAMLVGPADTDPTKWPALEDDEGSGAHKGGVVRPAKNMAAGKYQRVGCTHFDLYLQEGIGEQEGVYNLNFELFSNETPDGTRRGDVESLTTRVNFTPEGHRSKEIDDKQGQLDDLIAERNALTETFDRANEAFRDLKTDMKDKVKLVKGLLNKLAQAGIEWAQEDLNACENTPDQVGAPARVKHVLSSSICEQIATHAEKFFDEEEPRSAKKRQRKRMDAITMLGQPLVELGYADDPDLAHTLSWAVGSHAMDSVIAPDSTKQKELYTVHACNAYSEDQLEVFRTRQGERSAAHKTRGILPLELPLSHKAGNWPQERSEPVFLVNLIQLPVNQEHHRDTVFWQVLRNSILMDTLDEAQEYRRECIRHRKSVGNIYTRDGHLSSGGGLLRPGTGRPALDQMPNVFGALGTKNKMSNELASLKKFAVDLYEEHPKLEDANQALKLATTEREDKLETLKNQIEELERASSARHTLR